MIHCLYYFLLSVILLGISSAYATNWHCYYTNCLYTTAPLVYNSMTVSAVEVEFSILKKAERFGSFTNTTPTKTRSFTLKRSTHCFYAYHTFGAEMHRLWEPCETGITYTKTLSFSHTNSTVTLPAETYFFNSSAVQSCGPADTSDKIDDRKRAATQMLNQSIHKHKESSDKTNDILFISKWGYVS